MAKKIFSPAFKRQTAELVTLKGFSYLKACAVAGVSESALRRWVGQLTGELAGYTPEKATAITDSHREIQSLKARIRELEEDKEILKKATALLMSEPRIGRK
jgi:transposase